MGKYKNFKSVIYCTSQGMVNMTEEKLKTQLAFFQKYCGVDKVYLEPYRDGLMIPDEQLNMLKRVFEENGVEVSGAITTTCADLSPEDAFKQRMGGTYCYSNEAMRAFLVKTVAYTAAHFDEFIIDDWFFTMCTCEECRRAKGERSWEEFRRELLLDVSKNLVLKTAKETNPNCRVIIKYPNWSESYQEAGYDPARQRGLFDGIYSGTETRDTRHSDQHLPKYCSYSIVRLMENYAPGANGGGWFDPYGCAPMELYAEQAYLTAFARARELCQFCWGSLYKNKVVAPIGMQLEIIDELLGKAGAPVGVPCYLPPNAQGEDHVEDFLGMLGVPIEPTPDFPTGAACALFTAQSLADGDIIDKLKDFTASGGRAIVTGGFVIGALGRGIEDMTSIRYRGRRFRTDEFIEDGMMAPCSVFSREKMSFPLLEHRTNTTWALAKAVCGEENYPIVLRDSFGKGQMLCINLPDEFGLMHSLPREVLRVIRAQFTAVPYYLDAPSQLSMFCYDNDVVGLYRYVSPLARGRVELVCRGVADALENLRTGEVLKPAASGFGPGGTETRFMIPMLEQGDFAFFRVVWNANRSGAKEKREISSAPHDFEN
jgi:hypothetical protein